MTAHSTQKCQQARGHVEIAIQRLAGKYPFHAKTLERFDIRCSPEIGTIAVTVSGDDVRLLYNSGFVLGIRLDELGGVLLHEVHHVVFGHVLADPAEYPDVWARTVAEEVTVNEFVKEPLPGSPITLDLFSDLPAMESTHERYERLKKETRRLPLSSLGAVMGAGGNASFDSSSHERRKNSGKHADTADVLDDHSLWQGALDDRDRAEAALRAAVQDAVIDVGLDQVPACLREALSRMGIGRVAGGGEHEFNKSGRGRLDWVRLLRHFVGRHLTVQPDFMRPPRRFPDLVGIVPGRRRRGNRPHAMAVVDTSASVTPDLLELINAELSRLAGVYDVTVVECDAVIQRVYPYKPIRSVRGRGGTDLRPPFAPDFLRKHRPDLIIYFTDGEGPAPTKPPRVPVLWCLTPDGQRPGKWGRVIQMSAPDAKQK